MFPGDENKADYVRFRKILANQVAMTIYAGEVHAFDYGLGKEIWKLPAKMFNEPAITPGGRFAACMADKQCAIRGNKNRQTDRIDTSRFRRGAGFLGVLVRWITACFGVGKSIACSRCCQRQRAIRARGKCPLGQFRQTGALVGR